MSTPNRKLSRKKPTKDRRAPAGSPGSIRWLKGLLGRPVALERRGGQIHVVLVDRRRARAPGESLELEPLLDELRVRLLAPDGGEAMPALASVHDVLGRQGWRGVGALPSPVLRTALAQAEALLRLERSKALETIIDQLRVHGVGAELRAQRETQPRPAADAGPEVIESTPEEYAAIERAWVDTTSPNPAPPAPSQGS